MSAKVIGRRILQILIVLLGISFITFCLIYLAPGDPVTAMYANSGGVPNADVIAQTREELGLNRPFFVQYVSWLNAALHGDLGNSYTMSMPVSQILLSRLWPTVKLALFSIVLMLAFSVPMGMLTAVKKGKAVDYIVRVLTFIGNALPSFWIGLMLMNAFGLKLGILPVMSSDTGIQNLILPAVTLAVSMSAAYTRQVRAAILEEMKQGYVTGGKLRGLRPRVILWRHVFKNALLPLVTLLGLSFGSLMGGTAVVEVIFSYPGLGNLAVKAVTSRDYPLIQGYVLWTALIYMVINLIVDISYEYLDPRTKARRRA